MDSMEAISLLVFSFFIVHFDNVYACDDFTAPNGTKIACCSDRTQAPGDNISWPPSFGGQLIFSEALVLGNVVKKELSGNHGLYSVEFKVNCSYLQQLPRTITIKNTGVNPHTCHNSVFIEGKGYFVFLKKADSGYESTFEPILADKEETKQQYLDEIVFECNMKYFYPTGVTADQTGFRCELDLDDDPESCIEWEHDKNKVVPPTPRQLTDEDPKYEVNTKGNGIGVVDIDTEEEEAGTGNVVSDGGDPKSSQITAIYSAHLVLISLLLSIGLSVTT